MKKWFFRLIWIPVLIFAVLFLVANRQLVAISLDPFNASAPSVTTMAAPLWMWLITMVFLGFTLGAVAMWISARPKRAKARAEHRELKSLRRALTEERRRREEAERALPDSEGSAPTSVPSSPPLLEANSS